MFAGGDFSWLRRHALNLVVLIVPSVGVNSGAGQLPNNPGYGVWTPSLFGAHIGGATVFANFAVQAFDGATGQRLPIKIASVHKMADEMSPADALRAIVLEGLDEQLAHMHLTPAE